MLFKLFPGLFLTHYTLYNYFSPLNYVYNISAFYASARTPQNSTMTTPSNWTSAYNDAFRDRSKYISPNATQPMYHYKGTYDKSHYNPEHRGHGGQEASAYQTAYAQFDGFTANSISAQSGASTARQTSSSLASTQAATAGTVHVPTVIYSQGSTLSMSHGVMFPKAAPGGKDLWNSKPCTTHGGIVPVNSVTGESRLEYVPSSAYTYSSSASASTASGQGAGDLIGTGVPESAGWTRPKYHVPGYSGFVRGAQFRFGDTYGKSTRMALDVPTDLPLEP